MAGWPWGSSAEESAAHTGYGELTIGEQLFAEFLLDYADARDSEDPADTVLEFLQETYSAAADLAKWGRPRLDRQDEVAGAMRLKRPRRRSTTQDEERAS